MVCVRNPGVRVGMLCLVRLRAGTKGELLHCNRPNAALATEPFNCYLEPKQVLARWGG